MYTEQNKLSFKMMVLEIYKLSSPLNLKSRPQIGFRKEKKILFSVSFIECSIDLTKKGNRTKRMNE